jgi:hypothetical protein
MRCGGAGIRAVEFARKMSHCQHKLIPDWERQPANRDSVALEFRDEKLLGESGEHTNSIADAPRIAECAVAALIQRLKDLARLVRTLGEDHDVNPAAAGQLRDKV